MSIRGSATTLRVLLALFMLLCAPAAMLAQLQDTGVVSGNVVDTLQSKPVPGVVVTVRGTTLGAQTDASGNYRLEGVPPGQHILIFSKSGFERASVADVRVLIGQNSHADARLNPEYYEMDTYEVVAQLFEEQSVQLLQERQSSSAMIDALGSDFLSRVGAANAAESIAKVSGATISEGKFAVIRGLNGRYVTTTLNGAKIPSADPYRQTASLDLFPSQVIDKVVVAKTFTPDQPGTFTGGGIDIVTKSFPEKPFFSISLGGEYNTQASFNDHFLTDDGGSLDWAGMDDGTRAMPDALNDQIIPSRLVSSGSTSSPGFDKNVQSQYQLDAFTRSLGVTQFAPERGAPPLNHNFSMAGGGSTHLFDGPLLGYFVGVNYKHTYSFYEDGVYRRYGGVTPEGEPVITDDYRDSKSLSVVNWSGMVNLALKLSDDHELGFTFFDNQNGTDDVSIQDQGYRNYTPGDYRRFHLYYTERNLNTYQMRGEHHFPAVDNIKFNWLVALTGTTQDEPDARFFNDIDQGGGPSTGGNTVPSPSNPTRYFRNLDENNRNIKLDWEVPFPNWTDEDGKFKFGLFDSRSERNFVDRAFQYPNGGAYGGDPNQFLTEDNLGLSGVRTNLRSLTFLWGRYIQPYNSSAAFDSRYSSQQEIQAGYLMTELPLVSKLRLIGGVRYETTDLKEHSESYLASNITGQKTNDTVLKQSDLLPGVGLIYSISSNMNVRLNYSQTIARPSFRELAPYLSYDPTIDDYIEGNPLLNMTAIKNYDARWEWFPQPGEVFSVSLFYKELRNAIERGNKDTAGTAITYYNRDKAILYGIEIEARKRLDFLAPALSPFSLGGNMALVQSEVDLTPDELGRKELFFPGVDSSRPLYDQSPYILNLDMSYVNPDVGTTASLVLNISGPHIVITKLNAADVYEQPAPALDFIISQKLTSRMTVKFAAKNLLDPKIERTYGQNSELLYSSYTKGLTFGLSLRYDF